MKLEDQVVSLELAKKLYELGIKQDSLWWRQHNITGMRKGQKDGTVPYIFHSETKEIVDKENREHFNDDYSSNYRTERFFYSAFTVAELGEMLPKTIMYDFEYDGKVECEIEIKWNEITCYISYGWDDGYGGGNMACCLDDATEANARAKMLIYLIENNLVEVKL